MSDMPLNAVENTRDNFVQVIDDNSNFTKSPIKLSMTENRVIGGLKQLTEVLFKQHYKQRTTGNAVITVNGEPLQSDEITTSTEGEEATSSGIPMGDKENDENDDYSQEYLDDAMDNGQAEQFCAMVMKHLSNKQEEHSEAWHRGQLDAYNLAHKRLFEQTE